VTLSKVADRTQISHLALEDFYNLETMRIKKKGYQFDARCDGIVIVE